MKHNTSLVVCYTYFVVVSTGFDYVTPFLVPFQPTFLLKEGFPSALDFLLLSVLDLLIVLMVLPIL